MIIILVCLYVLTTYVDIIHNSQFINKLSYIPTYMNEWPRLKMCTRTFYCMYITFHVCPGKKIRCSSSETLIASTHDGEIWPLTYVPCA